MGGGWGMGVGRGNGEGWGGGEGGGWLGNLALELCNGGISLSHSSLKVIYLLA